MGKLGKLALAIGLAVTPASLASQSAFTVVSLPHFCSCCKLRHTISFIQVIIFADCCLDSLLFQYKRLLNVFWFCSIDLDSDCIDMFPCQNEKFVLYNTSPLHKANLKAYVNLSCYLFQLSPSILMSGQKHSGCEESQSSHCEPIAAQGPAQEEAEFDIYTIHREFSFNTAAFGS